MRALGARPLAIVALGASAGGLEAFQLFLDNLNDSAGLAFVVIQHLARSSETMLPALLARHTSLPVVAAEDAMTLEPDRLYVMPPQANLSLKDGRLRVEAVPEKAGVPLPIDHFLESLAQDQGSRAIAVILSGTGSDGSRGLQCVKEHGGVVLVQDPATAGQNGMPASAIRTGQVDYILPVPQMPAILLQYVQSFIAGGALPSAGPDAVIEAILGMVRSGTGYDFRGYKRGTLTRRVQRRMGLRGLSSAEEYLPVLRSDPDELRLLIKDLMIGVTRFFRDPEAYAFLQARVIRQLVQDAEPGATLRIWAAGCSSGEEPYSVAMLLSEEIDRAGNRVDFKIMASDIDREALDVARRGEYPFAIEADVTPDRLERFFVRQDDAYHIRRELRERIVFAEQNLVSDPPFSKLDLIVCRNLLIYLEAPVQAKVVELFHYLLNERGFLWLGSSESLGSHVSRFIPLSTKWRIFQRTGKRRHAMPSYPIVVAESPGPAGRASHPAIKPALRMADRVQKVLSDRYGPAAVLVGDRFEVLYLQGPIERYLAAPSGAAPFDLKAMCPVGLRHQVRLAVERSRRAQQGESVPGGQVERDGAVQPVSVWAEPVQLPEHPGATLVVFQDDLLAPVLLPATELSETDRGMCHRLEEELKATKADLNDTIEALEAANHELSSSNEEATTLNEEMQTANEELQSTNEELETSREELQSLNEELTSVNNELNEKLHELEGTNNDLINLLASTDIATLFLDLALRIRRFNPATRDLLSLLLADQGRPVGDFALKFSDPELLEDARAVLEHLQPIEKEIESAAGRWYLRRIVPYRTTSHKIDGVVITFAEISRIKAAEAALREAHEQLRLRNVVVEGQVSEGTAALGSMTQDLVVRSRELAAQKELFETIVSHAPVGIAYFASDLVVQWANPGLASMIGSPLQRLIRHRVDEAFAKFAEPILAHLRQVLEQKRSLEVQGVALLDPEGKTSETLTVDMSYVPVRDPRGEVVGIVGMFLDVSSRAEKARLQGLQIERLREVDRLKTDFLNAASHELRTPLSSVAGYAEFLEDRIGGPLTDEQDRFVAEIQRGSKRLQQLVDDLLDFARMEAGTFALVCQPVDLGHLIETELESLHPQATEAHLELQSHLPATPLVVSLDPQRIGQVILNVVGNAIKFTQAGGLIDVTLTQHPDEVKVEVQDNGPGIEVEHLPHLFERFYQGDPSLTRIHGGTGLGLAISKSIVEAHGGTIGVESQPQPGSTFWFTLPLGKAPGAR